MGKFDGLKKTVESIEAKAQAAQKEQDDRVKALLAEQQAKKHLLEARATLINTRVLRPLLDALVSELRLKDAEITLPEGTVSIERVLPRGGGKTSTPLRLPMRLSFRQPPAVGPNGAMCQLLFGHAMGADGVSLFVATQVAGTLVWGDTPAATFEVGPLAGEDIAKLSDEVLTALTREMERIISPAR